MQAKGLGFIPLPPATIDRVLEQLQQSPGAKPITAAPGRHLQGREFIRRARELEAREHAQQARQRLGPWH